MINARDADCHYGDHYWATNGFCDNCGAFNAYLLLEAAYEKARKLGLNHDDHFHRSLKTYNTCKAIKRCIQCGVQINKLNPLGAVYKTSVTCQLCHDADFGA